MVNCNPETVSTDYDTSDRLFFEPLTEEDVLNICERCRTARASCGASIVALGGQTPLKLAHILEAGRHPDPRHEPGVDRPGRGPRAVQRAVRPARHPAARRRRSRPTSTTRSRSRTTSAIRCSCGRRTCSAAARCRSSTTTPTCAARWPSSPNRLARARRRPRRPNGPRSIDRFLEDAVEVDVDALRDRTGEVVIGGVMEHIEEAGVHSGDSACAIPPPTLPGRRRATIEQHTRGARRRARRHRAAATSSTR